MTKQGQGTVTLVGAGPGDPELLTIKAARAIAQAGVLLVDDLVSDAIVALASPAARVIHVGKRGGCRSTPQAFIEKLMVSARRSCGSRAAIRSSSVAAAKRWTTCVPPACRST